MDLSFTPDQDALREATTRLYGKESHGERVREAEATGFDPALWDAVVTMGLPTMALAEGDGGAGASLTDLAAAVEVHGAHLGSIPLVETAVAARLLARVGGADHLATITAGAPAALGLRPANAGVAPLVPGAAVAGIVVARDGDRIVAVSAPRATSRRTLASLAIADVDLDGATVLAEGPMPSAPTRWPWTSGGPSRPWRRPGWPGPRSTSACSTRRTATSSACRSAASRPCSTASPTCTRGSTAAACSPTRPCGRSTRPRPRLVPSPPRRPGGAARWPTRRPGSASTSTAATGSCSSTTCSCTSAGPRPPACCSAIPATSWSGSPSTDGEPHAPDPAAVVAAATDRPTRAGMDYRFDPETEAFRSEVRAFIAEHLDDEIVARAHRTGTMHDWGFHRALCERGYLAAGWPTEVGGLGSQRHRPVPARAGAVRLRRSHRRPEHRRDGRCHPAPLRHRRAEGHGRASHPGRRGHVLPRLQRARRRLGRRRGGHQGRARRGQLGHRRAEDVHDDGARGALRVPARPVEPRRGQAQGPHDVPRPDGHAGHRDHARGDHGRRAHQHHLLQRRCASPTRPASARSTPAGP